MPMRRCAADEHYYDDSQHAECPYCRQTAPKGVRDPTGAQGRSPKQQTAAVAVKTGPPAEQKPKTRLIVSDRDKEMPPEADQAPVTGWLVVIDGPGKGKDLRITPGMNRIGRDASMNLPVDFGDEFISRSEHAFVIYDPQSNAFFLNHGSGQNLTYLNDELVMEPKTLQARDRIKMGQTEFLFVPFCTERFRWGQG